MAILDTDIGDDIDDAFALALALKSPELKLLGITTEFGDTELRARLVDRYLAAVGRSDIPVAAGKPTPHSNVFTQAAYAEQEPDRKHADGVQFLLDQIGAHPGEVTLIAIGPLVNVGAAIERDPATFRKVKRVVMMGGSIYRGYDADGQTNPKPDAEWNIARDPAGAKALLDSGVPVFMMPLDSTQIHLEELERERIFSYGSPRDRPTDAALPPVGRAQRHAQPDTDALRPGGSDVCGAAGAVSGAAHSAGGGRPGVHPAGGGSAKCTGLSQVG